MSTITQRTAVLTRAVCARLRGWPGHRPALSAPQRYSTLLDEADAHGDPDLQRLVRHPRVAAACWPADTYASQVRLGAALLGAWRAARCRGELM